MLTHSKKHNTGPYTHILIFIYKGTYYGPVFMFLCLFLVHGPGQVHTHT
jgi:hypothetical protein